MGVFDIQGRDCVFQLKIGDDYFTVVCAKSFTFNPVTDMKETTTVGSGFWKEFRPRKLSYTITFNGMFQVASLGTQEKIKTMFDYQIGFLPLNYRLLYTDASSNVMIVEGAVYVTSTLLDASPVNLVNGTIELQGNGSIQVLDALPTPINIHIVSTGDPSIGAFVQFKLINSDGETIFDSGQLPEASGGNLSHPFDVTGQIESGSYYFFWQVTTDSIGNVFDLDAPPTKITNFNDATNNENSFGVQIYDFTADRDVIFALGVLTPPPTCVVPTIPGSPALPDGTQYVAYSYSYPIAGTVPVNIANVTKPSWMLIDTFESGGTTYVLHTGTPDSTGTAIVVSYDITNACGTVGFSDTIDIDTLAGAIPIAWDFSETESSCGFRLWVNGSIVINTDVPASGTVYVSSFDNIEVFVVGNVLTTKHLDVQETTGPTELYNETQGGSFLSFAWTAVAFNIYEVNASGGA